MPSLWIAGVVAAATAGWAAGQTVGPGLVSTTGADSGERLNVDDTFTQTLNAGTYNVTNFSYNSTAAAGNTVPFLATLSAADEYQLLWIGSNVPGALNATASVDPAGTFTLAAPATVYAGFYTTGGGRVAFTTATQTTDHDNTFAVPRAGVAINTFSNANLPRTYAFSIAAALTPTGTRVAGPGFLATDGADTGDRLNVDNVRPISVAAGTYDVTDFAFNGTAAAGTVTPFLARLTGTDTYQTVWVGAPVAGALAGVSVDPAGGFTLATGETLYAGFYTAGGGAVAFTEGVGRPPGFGITDHDSTFTGPTAAGDTVGGFSNADLARQYSFSISFAVPEPSAAGLALLGGACGLLRRRRAAAGA